MKNKVLGTVAVVALLGACSNSPEKPDAKLPGQESRKIQSAAESGPLPFASPVGSKPKVQHDEIVKTKKSDVEASVRHLLEGSKISSLDVKLVKVGELKDSFRTDTHKLTDSSPVWWVRARGEMKSVSGPIQMPDGRQQIVVGQEMIVLVSAETGEEISASLIDPKFKNIEN